MVYILSSTPVEGAKNLAVIRQRFFDLAIDFLSYDYLIFTSKNGVIAAQRISQDWKRVPSIVIGQATAQMVERLGGQVAFVASKFYGEELAKEIRQHFDPKKRYLFLRPKVVSSDLKELLEEFSLEERIVYETQCVECGELEAPKRGAIIIFSSPSTVSCFFRCLSWDESYLAYALGKKTAAALPRDIEYRLCRGKTLQECVDLILSNERFLSKKDL